MTKPIQTLGRWLAFGGAVGILCGSASALFLRMLEWVTNYRTQHIHIVYALPFAGAAIGLVYSRFGASIRRGNNLILETIHGDGPKIPLRMAPMVLAGTVLTHLFGGSAGREGTAIQMGGSLADLLAHHLRLSSKVRRQLLAAGMAGGFGSVFGCPFAGTVFGLEVIHRGKLEYRAMVPGLIASVLGDRVTRALGIHHTRYPQLSSLNLTPTVGLKWLVFSVAVAAAAIVFIEAVHHLKRKLEVSLPSLCLRMVLGGIGLIFLWRLLGNDYLGLGIPTLLRAFSDPSLPPYAFAAKMLFTAVTLGSGFLGGEVTPLFFIGACLGNGLGQLLHLPLQMAAGVGMAALFAAAAKTPLALTVMAIELLGMAALPHVLLVAVVATLLTGSRGIYPAQVPELT